MTFSHTDVIPVGVSQGVGSWSIGGGAISYIAAVTDNVPTTYVALSGSQFLDTIVFDMGPAAIPATAGIDYVVATYLGDATTSPNALAFIFGRIGEGYDPTLTVGANSDIVANMPNTYGNYNSNQHPRNPSGAPWAVAEINSGTAFLAGIQGTPQGSQINIAEFHATAWWYPVPTVNTVTGPGSGSTTNQPTISWTATSDLGQARFRVKVFSQDEYTLPGFDPNVSAAVYDSGDVVSAQTSFRIPVGLSNSLNFWVYVQVAQQLPTANVPHYSVWGPYATFSTAVPGPTATVTAPTGTITKTTRPIVAWTFSDAATDVSVQSHYQVRVFDAVTYGASVTFSPDTATPIYDSGDITAADGSHVPNQDLPNGTLRAYVRVAGKLAGNPDQWGLWSYSQWVQIAPTPAPPGLVATADDGVGGVKLDVVGQTNQLSANQANLENGNVVGWAVDVNATLTAASAVTAPAGVWYLQIAATATGDAQAVATGAAVTGGQSMTAQAVFADATVSRICQVGFRWWDFTNAKISEDWGVGVADGPTGSPWTQAHVSAVAPAIAVRYDVLLKINAPAAGEVHYADAISASPGDATTWGPGGLVWGPGGLTSAAGYLIEYSDDGGLTWNTGRVTSLGVLPSYVRTASTTALLSPDPLTEQATTHDYESPAASPRMYRTRTSVLIGGAHLVSGPSLPVSATTHPKRWWLKDPEFPELNIQVYIGTDALVTTDTERQGVFQPAGGTRQIVVSGPLYGETFSLDLSFADDTTYQGFLRLRRGQRVLLLQSPFGPQWYMRFGASRATTLDLLDTSYLTRTVQVTCVEVDPP